MLLILFTPSQLLLSDSISLLQEYNSLRIYVFADQSAVQPILTQNYSFQIKVILLLPKCRQVFNPLNTKRRSLYLKTHFVPRSKHFSSRL